MENIVDYTDKDLKRIRQSMKHHIMVNMSYNLLHALIHFNCLSEFISEVIHYNMSFRNYNYRGLNLYKKRSNYITFYIVTTFSWKDSIKGIRYWKGIYAEITNYEQEIETNKVQEFYLFQINWSKK